VGFIGNLVVRNHSKTSVTYLVHVCYILITSCVSSTKDTLKQQVGYKPKSFSFVQTASPKVCLVTDTRVTTEV
jgi:hypothetical protein